MFVMKNITKNKAIASLDFSFFARNIPISRILRDQHWFIIFTVNILSI